MYMVLDHLICWYTLVALPLVRIYIYIHIRICIYIRGAHVYTCVYI